MEDNTQINAVGIYAKYMYYLSGVWRKC